MVILRNSTPLDRSRDFTIALFQPHKVCSVPGVNDMHVISSGVFGLKNPYGLPQV